MRKKVNQDQIRKIVKLVDKQDYSFTDAGKAVGLCSKTASKHYWNYKEPEIEKPIETELKELVVIKQDRKKTEEKRKLLESLDRNPSLPLKPATEVANRPRTSEESRWKLLGIIALISAITLAALIYFKKKPEEPAKTKEKVSTQNQQPLPKNQRKTVTFSEFRGI